MIDINHQTTRLLLAATNTPLHTPRTQQNNKQKKVALSLGRMSGDNPALADLPLARANSSKILAA